MPEGKDDKYQQVIKQLARLTAFLADYLDRCNKCLASGDLISATSYMAAVQAATVHLSSLMFTFTMGANLHNIEQATQDLDTQLQLRLREWEAYAK